MNKIEIQIIKRIPLIFSLFISGLLFGQNNNFKNIEELLKSGKNYSALKILNEQKIETLSGFDLGNLYYYTAKAYSNENLNDKSFYYFIKSKQQFIKLDSIEKAMNINLDIAFLFGNQKSNFIEAKKYISTYLEFAKKSRKSNLLAKGYSKWATILIEENPKMSLMNFKLAEKYNSLSNNDNVLSSIYNNTAVIYSEIIIKPDSALYFLNKAMLLAKKSNNQNDICTNLVNQAGVYYNKDEYQTAIKLLIEANNIPITKYVSNIKSIIYNVLSLNNLQLGDFKNAFYNLTKSNEFKDKEAFEKQEIKISELQIQYKTQQKELENLSLKNKNQRKTVLVYSFLGLFLLTFLIGYLAYKNLSKRKKITEQEKQLEIQKLETSLKEQELHEIDIMLESQEKERQQIANDLHDNLGSMLATLKLNFENLKRQDINSNEKESQLYSKTDSLIEEAYQKVRNISHLKNLGVIASEGLLVAVKKMAEKMSVLERLQFNVIPYGLNDRLENSLEVMLFRIIQELCTNIIKHADATEVNIYLTQHDTHEINIIIEDNGKGFDFKNSDSRTGIGLKNIEKKVEQMNGTFTIDSINANGTTIIIDLPI